MRVPSHHWVTSCLIFHCQSKACHTYPTNLKNIQNWKSFRNHNLSSKPDSSVVDFPTRMFPSDIQPTVEESLKKGGENLGLRGFIFCQVFFGHCGPLHWPYVLITLEIVNLPHQKHNSQVSSVLQSHWKIKEKYTSGLNWAYTHSNIKLCRYLFWNI